MVRKLLYHFVFSTIVSENLFCHCSWMVDSGVGSRLRHRSVFGVGGD